MRAASSRVSRGLLLLLAFVALLLPRAAAAEKRSMIPPGQEQRIRELVDVALSAARSANELPVAVDERTSIQIDHDRIRVTLHPLELDAEPLPRLIVFHPEAVAADAGEALAPGVTIECGSPVLPIRCAKAIASAWTPTAARLAEARAPWVETLWQIEETGTQSFVEIGPIVRSPVALWIDRGAAIAAVVLGLGLIGLARRHRHDDDPPRASVGELALLLGLLALFLGASASFTAMLPLHEHNSFIARSDCALDQRCVDDPAAAWSMTTMHGYGLLLELIPYRAGAIAWLSLAVSSIMLVLVWALARRIASELGQRDRAPTAGLVAVAVLATNPVMWRLSGAGTFWPWTLCWILTAALAGLWAARSCASEHRRVRLTGALAWVLAAISLAFAAAGNVVCLTLGACLLLAPACWSRASSLRSALGRAAWIGPLAVGAFALIAAPDYLAGFERAFGPTGIDDSFSLSRITHDFNPLLFDPQIVTPVWALASLAAVLLGIRARRLRAGSPKSLTQTLRLLVPLGWAYLIPAAFFGAAAGDVVGSGYPVGFINHHWELVFTAIIVGLALAHLVGSLEQLRPARWTFAIPMVVSAAALLLAPLAREGWRMATGERVLERELLALERSFATLPEHDLLVVAPRILEPLTDAPTQWDPLEVVFPVGFYEHAMRERGLEPALVVSLDHIPPARPNERILLYVGSSLRSFQPHEIAEGVVPDQLERPILARLRDEWALEVVEEFVIRTEQHEAISQRLAADRMAEIELGFYRMHKHR